MNPVVRSIVDYLLDPQEDPLRRLFPTPPTDGSPPNPGRSGGRQAGSERGPETPPNPRADLTRARASLAAVLEHIEQGRSGLGQDQEEGLASFVTQAMVKLRWADHIFEQGRVRD